MDLHLIKATNKYNPCQKINNYYEYSEKFIEQKLLKSAIYQF